MQQEKNKERYLDEAAGYRLLVAREDKILLFLSISRLCIFAVGLILIWLAFTQSLIALLIPALIILFLYLLKLYSDHSEKKDFLAKLVLVNQNEAEAASGNLSVFESGSSYADPHHNFSNDVDLFGNNSLFQYLNRTVTGYGRDILAGWLSEPFALSGDLILRQEAIKELAIREKWRHRFMASGLKKPLEKSNIVSLIEWMNEGPVIKSTILKRVLIYVLPTAAVISLLLVSTGVIHYSVFTFFFLVNLLAVTAGLKKTNKIHSRVTGVHNYLSSIYQLLKTFDNEVFNSSHAG